MTESVAQDRNGATWIRDCLLDSPEMVRAVGRLQVDCREGIRHFSAIGRAVRLDQAGKMQIEIARLEEEADVEPGARSHKRRS